MASTEVAINALATIDLGRGDPRFMPSHSASAPFASEKSPIFQVPAE
jgi:hypothetical protein